MPPASNQPDFPAPTPGQPQHDPYGFFMSPQQTPKKNPLHSAKGMGLAPKLLLGLLAVLFLICIFAVVSSLLGGKGDTAPLVSIASDQQEIIRVAQDGTDTVNASRLKNFAVTADLSLTSAQKDLIKHITASGTKVETQQLASPQAARTDKALEASLASNTYDTTFTTIMQTGLTSYLAKLETAANNATSKTEERLLNKQADEAKLLIQQLGD